MLGEKLIEFFSPAAHLPPPHYKKYHLGKKFKSRRGGGHKYEFQI